MSDLLAPPVDPTYEISTHKVRGLSSATLVRCLALIEEGGAVDVKSAAVTMMRSRVIILARTGGNVIGVGVMKPYRQDYAAAITEKCGATPPEGAPELGYVAVDINYRCHGIAHQIMTALCAGHQGDLFATTSDKTLKKYMEKSGFAMVGHEWDGKRGDQLSLWVRTNAASGIERGQAV